MVRCPTCPLCRTDLPDPEARTTVSDGTVRGSVLRTTTPDWHSYYDGADTTWDVPRRAVTPTTTWLARNASREDVASLLQLPSTVEPNLENLTESWHDLARRTIRQRLSERSVVTEELTRRMHAGGSMSLPPVHGRQPILNANGPSPEVLTPVVHPQTSRTGALLVERTFAFGRGASDAHAVLSYPARYNVAMNGRRELPGSFPRDHPRGARSRQAGTSASTSPSRVTTGQLMRFMRF